MATMPKPTTPTDAEQAIRALGQEYVRYYNARDVDKLVALFTKDGCTFAPYHPLAEGTAALRQALQQSLTEYDPRDLRVETTHVEVDGNIAFSFGTFTMNLRTPKGPRLDDKGKWIVTLRREGGTWRIVGHCFNTDLPITTLASL
jgi:uncharacterized protein (TIGR02246 family)